MVDCSHANAAKEYRRQVDVARDIARADRAAASGASSA